MLKRKSAPRRTQFFSSVLAILMERNGINQVRLAASTGIAVSRINNYLKGKYRTIRPDHLASLAKAAGQNATERGELASAYVQDILPGELHGAIRIEVAGENPKAAKQVASEKSLLPKAAAEALQDLQTMSVRNAKARERMQQFAEMLGEIYHA
jgi:transcriptional regulator with XRE-family HTH domain